MHGTLLGVTKMLLTLAVQKYFPVQIFEICCVRSQNPLHRCDTCDQEFVRAYNWIKAVWSQSTNRSRVCLCASYWRQEQNGYCGYCSKCSFKLKRIFCFCPKCGNELVEVCICSWSEITSDESSIFLAKFHLAKQETKRGGFCFRNKAKSKIEETQVTIQVDVVMDEMDEMWPSTGKQEIRW